MPDTTTTTPDASTPDLPDKYDPSIVQQAESPSYSIPQCATPQPSIWLLFSLIPRHDFYTIVLPAILMSMFTGGVAPFMTYVVGEAFDGFSTFSAISDPTQSDKHALLRNIGLSAVELVGLAVGALVLSSITSCLWIYTGERNLMAARKTIYTAVSQKDMVWFDTKMGTDDSVQMAEGEGPLGAGGLMAKFARETDEIRMGSSLAAGYIVQYLTTTLTCLILAFYWSWSLTLIILSVVPVIVLVQTISQIFAGTHLGAERAYTATAATLVDRALVAIATVKAFNAEAHEHATLSRMLEAIQGAANGCIKVWGVSSGLGQFVTMAMFVQGFWFGAKLVRDGDISSGKVMSVFWACLIGQSNLQMCIPQLIVLNKGKFSMAALIALAESPAPESAEPTIYSAAKIARRPTLMRKVVPLRCYGEFELEDITFAYPSRPTVPVLKNISLFLAANDTSFIVGGSGSGKSTIAQLLLRMYAPQQGSIRMDDQGIVYLDETWMGSHIAAVSQGCILFDMSVHDNVAIGLAYPGSPRRPEDVSRTEVEAVCRAALMHEFVRDLPNGYDTMLGTAGANLSGGQKQRLAIARALLRNPTVLILDEATSALDVTSRILVFEAVKRWRVNMTTIVITHDLSQIGPEDYVHVLKSGELVEQGYRNDLESCIDGEFRQMLNAQEATGGFKEKMDDNISPSVEALFEEQDETELEERSVEPRPQSTPPTLRPLTLGNWMFDVVATLTRPAGSRKLGDVEAAAIDEVATCGFSESDFEKERRRKTLNIDIPPVTMPIATASPASHRYSLQFTVSSPCSDRSTTFLLARDEEDEIVAEKRARMKRAKTSSPIQRIRARWDEKGLAVLKASKAESETISVEHAAPVVPLEETESFRSLVRDVYSTMADKRLLLFGVLCCVASGAITPIFSFLLSRILFEVGIGATDVSTINKFGGIVLAVAALDGIFIGLKYAVMEVVAMRWVTDMRKLCMTRVLAQDKKWFDKSENSPMRLVQILIKDGDDARSLIATVLCQAIVVVTMLGLGLIWAIVRGWQLTLVGFAIAPVFAIVNTLQTRLVAKCQMRNKRAREEVAKDYYETISNVRGIRSMGLDTAFKERYGNSVERAFSAGVRGAFVEGCSYGVASALIYLSEALLFYVGAVLLARGLYSYLQMVEVLNLVVFTVSIGSQLMNFTERIAKSVQATRDFSKLLKLSMDTDESLGWSKPEIKGPISFKNIAFSYPERADVPVLKGISVDIAENECVAIVGSSGCGKSTIASLLQRLYEPGSGSISVNFHNLSSTEVHHLREHVAVVSQHANLFDATIAENISYGSTLSIEDIQCAAKAAHVHDFIESLPKGYDTLVGENAALISGGQAQRLQIARALARPARILILDECTSALDAENQAAVMETLKQAKVGRTTLVVTHKLQMMRMCDRILVVQDGIIAEQGSFQALMEKRGVFAQLARGGEWTGE